MTPLNSNENIYWVVYAKLFTWCLWRGQEEGLQKHWRTWTWEDLGQAFYLHGPEWRNLVPSLERTSLMLLPSLACAFLIFYRILELGKFFSNPSSMSEKLSLECMGRCFQSSIGEQNSYLFLSISLILCSPEPGANDFKAVPLRSSHIAMTLEYCLNLM